MYACFESKYNKMKKILLYAVLAVCALGGHAQEMTPEEVVKLKKEMNDIKRSEDFIFADGLAEYLSDDSEKAVSQATQQSMMKLKTQIVTVFAKHMHMSAEDVQEIWDTIEDKLQNVEVTTGGVARSFFYVSKEVLAGLVPDIHLFPNNKKKAEYPVASQTDVAATQPQADAPVATVVQETTVVKKVSVTQETKADDLAAADTQQEDTVAEAQADALEAAEAQPVTTTTTTTTITTTNTTVAQNVATEEAKEEPAAPAAPVVETPKEEPVVAPAPEPAVVKVEVPAFCQTLLDKKNYKALMSYLQTEKAYGHLIFGPESRMSRTAQCYIVLIEKSSQNITAVLDKGVTERMNFVTGKMDDFANYMLAGGYLAIFVQDLN